MSPPVLTPQRDPLDTRRPDAPRLLVSVRDASEAVVALVAGVDLLDCKEPRRGSLGRPTAGTQRDVVAARDQLAPLTPVSVALGELADMTADGEPPRSDWTGIAYIKFGLATLAKSANWQRRWRDAVESIRGTSPSPPQIVAVAYADWPAAQSPPIADVLSAARELGYDGLLFDTWSKSDGRLLSHLPPDELGTWVEEIHAAGLFAAVAGQLQRSDLAKLAAIPIDIIAVRSAVCAGSDRRGRLSGALVAEFRHELERVWLG